MRTTRLLSCAPLVMPAFMALGGCLRFGSGLESIQIWGTSEATALAPDSAPEIENEVFSDASKTLRLDGAVNETISLQLAFRATKNPIIISHVAPSELRLNQSVIPALSMHLYREVCVAVSEYPSWWLRLTPELRRAREFADVLVPLTAPHGGLPIEIPAGQTIAVWLDMTIPPGTPPGTYRGKLSVGAQGGSLREINLAVEVWPFALPQTRHLAVTAGISTAELLRHHLVVGGQPYAPPRLSFEDPAYTQAAAIIDDTLRLLHDHRCSPVLTDVYPLARLAANGRSELDWTDYDRLVSGILDGTLFEDRAAAVAWPLPVDSRNPPPDINGGWGSPSHNQAITEYLRQSVAHFREKGWFDRHYAWAALPAAGREAQYDEFDRLGRLMLSVEPRLNLLCSLAPQPMTPYGLLNDGFRDISSLVGTWCPPASRADPAELHRQRSLGKTVWLSPDRPPFAGSLSLIAPPAHARSVAWQAYRFACAGIFLPQVNQWSAQGNPAADGSAEALIWPGKPYGLLQPVASIRLKRLRRGLQDQEYLWLLGQNRRPGIAQLIAADLFAYGGTQCYGEHCLDGRPGGWINDPSAWTMARRLMARELIAALHQDKAPHSQPGDEDDLLAFERQMEWARLTEETRGVRADVEGVRLQLDEKQKDTPLMLEATVSLFNATRDPFSGVLSFAGVPEDWKLDAARLTIDRLESRRSARRVLSGHVPNFAANSDGVLPIQVALDRRNGETKSVPARIAALTSEPLTQPITMDGKLTDWPLGTTNVAGDFVLVGALDVPKRGRSSPDRASQQTLVFVCNDSNYLYLGFNCADDHLADRIISRGNAVRYDELWPTGEDLVEVVLDPTHRAVDSGDLLHFVVKSNGAVISERGVPCLAGVARYSDWPAGVEAAISDTLDKARWTVEMRIPIKALAGRPGIWGVNFGRLNARLGEYSSWSGARRFLYSPASLGNLRVNY